MRERLHYIDLAKGLLILMVAYGHVWYHICHNDGFNNVYMSELHELSNVWVAFYMPAFFVITGMCSNFERTWKTFWTSQLKSLILPAFTLGLVVNAISWLLSDSEFHLGLKVFLKGNGFWFLSSLFVAKIIFYCLNKFAGNMKTIVFVTIILYSAFVVVHNFFSMVSNYWCWIHAFGLFPYLVLGQALRRWNVMKHNRILLAVGGVYVVILLLYLSLGVKIPRITGGVYVPLVQAVPSLILSVTGTLFLLYVCKKINRVAWLECLGKHSLVIYCIHEGLLSILSPWLGNNIVQAVRGQAFVYYTMLLIYIVTASWLISLLLNKKPFNFIIGKF